MRFVSFLATGLAYGSTSALVAAGFLVLYRATGVFNFAHGDLMVLGAFLAYWAVAQHGMPVLAGYLVAIVLLGLAGVFLERVAYAPLRGRPVMVVLVSTLGAATAIRAGVNLWQGAQLRRLPSPVGEGAFHIGGASVPYQSVLATGVSLVAVLGILAMFQWTTFGRNLRAVADDRESAALLGVSVPVLGTLAFALSAALAALAGVLISPMTGLNLTFGFSFMLVGAAAAIIGGFGSISGAALVAVLLGVLEQVVGGFYLTQYREAFPFVIMLVALVIRPNGLFQLSSARRL
jgi:branched-chain amino acid transport system permease protein